MPNSDAAREEAARLGWRLRPVTLTEWEEEQAHANRRVDYIPEPTH